MGIRQSMKIANLEEKITSLHWDVAVYKSAIDQMADHHREAHHSTNHNVPTHTISNEGSSVGTGHVASSTLAGSAEEKEELVPPATRRHVHGRTKVNSRAIREHMMVQHEIGDEVDQVDLLFRLHDAIHLEQRLNEEDASGLEPPHMYMLTSEDLTHLGGPMGSEYTTVNWTQLFSSSDAAKAYAENYYDKLISWRETTVPKGWTSGDLGHVMYIIKEVVPRELTYEAV